MYGGQRKKRRLLGRGDVAGKRVLRGKGTAVKNDEEENVAGVKGEGK